MRADLHVPVLGRRRGEEQLDWTSSAASPSVEAVVDCVAGAASGAVWLGGGEPTLRADLPALLQALADKGDVGLDTDGLALSRAPVVSSLQRAGLRRVRIALHSGQTAAHDWLVGLPGAGRRARQAIETCARAGLLVHAVIVPTRPTMDHLPETVALLAGLGVSAVRIRRLRRQGPAGQRYVTLSPRLGLLESFLEAAVHRGRDAGVAVTLEGFPRCAAPRVPAGAFAPDGQWLVPAGWPPDALPQPMAVVPGCGRCGTEPTCAGAPADYVARFGRTEFDSETALPLGRPHPRPPGGPPPEPAHRAGRHPGTRIRTARRLVQLGDLGGDPLAERQPGQAPAAVSLELDPARSSRALRQELVRVAQEGASVLWLTGSFAHPAALAVARDALRMRHWSVHLHGDLSPLGGWPRRDIVALRRLGGARSTAPDCPGAARLAEQGVPVG